MQNWFDTITVLFFALYLVLCAGFIVFIKAKTGKIFWHVVSAFCAILVLAVGASIWRGNIKDQELRRKLQNQSLAISITINQERIEGLSFTINDTSAFEFKRLREQMRLYESAIRPFFNTSFLSIYSVVKKDSAFVFGPESIPTDHKNSSLPGTEYLEPPEGLKEVFTTGQVVTYGPYKDEYGTFISSFAPVFDPKTNKVTLAIGMDIDYSDWESAILKQKAFSFLSALLLTIILGVGVYFHTSRNLLKGKIFYIYLEAFIVFVFGIILTIIVTVAIIDFEARNKFDVFTQVTEPESKSLIKSFRNMRDFQIGGIARYFEGNANVTRNEFKDLIAPMTRLSGVQNITGWIIPIREEDRKAFEQKAIDDGVKDFYIWEKDQSGNKIPAVKRDVHYIVWYAEPENKENALTGFDLLSDSLNKSNIKNSLQTKLPVAFSGSNKEKREIIVFHPIFSTPEKNGEPRGFVLGILKMDSYIRKALSVVRSSDELTKVKLVQILSNYKPEFIASTSNDIEDHQVEFFFDENYYHVIHPLFIFGNTYIIITTPGKNSFASNDSIAGWISLVSGSVLTLLFTLFTVFLARRHAYLEKEVEKRTIELQKSETKTNEIVQTAQDAIIMIDDHGNISLWNLSAERIFGYKTEEVIGKELHRLITPESYYDTHIKAFKKFVVTGEGNAIGKVLELVAKNKSGEEFPVELSLSAVNIEGKWNAVGVIRDISERKKAETALKESKELAEAASKAKSDFLANMSHEIRTPLNGVIGFTELLSNTKLDNVQMQYVQSVNTSAASLLSIINDILDFSKIEAGKLELEIIRTNLLKLLEGTADIVNLKVNEKGLELILNISENVPTYTFIDPVRLRQVLINLLSNAVKFTENGEIELQVNFVKTDDNSNTGKLFFSVSDTGIGIKKEDKEKLFRAFSQADMSTTRKFGGTGLGLVISNRLIEKMGGKIKVESEEGIGSKFYFEIEVGFDTSGEEPVKELPVTNVLIVDDNEKNRIILKHNFDNRTIKNETAETGYKALELINKSEDFDIVIMDYNMPGMNGVKTIKRINELLRIKERNIPDFILYSSVVDHSEEAEFGELNIKAKLVKPVRATELFDTIRRIRGDFPEQVKKPDTVSLQEMSEGINLLKPKILTVDDIKLNLQLLKSIIGELMPEAEIFEAADGEQAVEIYKEIIPDIVFMDIQMPNKDGYAASMEIRDFEKTTEIHKPIIALTAGTVKGEKEKCIAAGMDDYMPKPFAIGDLTKIIKQYIAKDVNAVQGANIRMKESEKLEHFNSITLMETLGGNEKLFKQIIKTSESEFDTLLENLSNAVKEKDYKAVKIAAHTIKGAAGNISFNKLSLFAKQLESAADDKEAEKYLKILIDEWAVVKQILLEI